MSKFEHLRRLRRIAADSQPRPPPLHGRAQAPQRVRLQRLVGGLLLLLLRTRYPRDGPLRWAALRAAVSTSGARLRSAPICSRALQVGLTSSDNMVPAGR